MLTNVSTITFITYPITSVNGKYLHVKCILGDITKDYVKTTNLKRFHVISKINIAHLIYQHKVRSMLDINMSDKIIRFLSLAVSLKLKLVLNIIDNALIHSTHFTYHQVLIAISCAPIPHRHNLLCFFMALIKEIGIDMNFFREKISKPL